MADRRPPYGTRTLVVVALVLVLSGISLAVTGSGSGDTSARRPAPRSEAPYSTTTIPASIPAPVSARTPRRAVVGGPPQVVVVPVLDISAPVDPIRVEAGALTPPSDPGRIGWWADGARPGARHGKAVLTGHTVNAGGGAFDDLETLAAGETVVVEATGGRVTYDVTSVRVLSRDQLARQSESIFRPSGPHRLVLITCEDWDGVAYRSNVVVEAEPRT